MTCPNLFLLGPVTSGNPQVEFWVEEMLFMASKVHFSLAYLAPTDFTPHFVIH